MFVNLVYHTYWMWLEPWVTSTVFVSYIASEATMYVYILAPRLPGVLLALSDLPVWGRQHPSFLPKWDYMIRRLLWFLVKPQHQVKLWRLFWQHSIRYLAWQYLVVVRVTGNQAATWFDTRAVMLGMLFLKRGWNLRIGCELPSSVCSLITQN